MSPVTRWLMGVCASLGFLLSAGACHAACNALTICVCTTSSTGVSFGNYRVSDTIANDAAGSVTVTCLLTVAKAGSFTLALSAGNSTSFTSRTMTSGGFSLKYNLYSTDARNQVVGDGTGGSVTLTGAIASLLTSITTLNIYGRAPSGQNVPNGNYTDSLVVTITY